MEWIIVKNLCFLVPRHLILFTPAVILGSHRHPLHLIGREAEAQSSPVLPKVMQRRTPACLSPKLWCFCAILG